MNDNINTCPSLVYEATVIIAGKEADTRQLHSDISMFQYLIEAYTAVLGVTNQFPVTSLVEKLHNAKRNGVESIPLTQTAKIIVQTIIG